MPTATHNETRETVLACHAAPRSEFTAPAPEVQQASAGVSRLPHAAGLADLLAEDPVDLARVSDEIRAQPALADVVKRVAAMLQVSPYPSVSSVEEAAVLLGTDRLRVLLHAFPAIVKLHKGTLVSGSAAVERPAAANAKPASAEVDIDGSAAARAPESIYLASFVRLLGLDDSHAGALPDEIRLQSLGASPSEVAEITEILVRDVLALVPRISQARRKSAENR